MPFSGWSDRAQVHQAVGMVVAQLRVSTEDALAILRAHAFAEGTNLDVIAALILERRLDFTHPQVGATPTDTAHEDSTRGDEP